jgi:superfamily II DNA or RNA helicase
MVAYTGTRSHSSKQFMDFLQSREWGFLLLDEVHVAPDEGSERLTCKTELGVRPEILDTPTLVREDDRIEDLNYIIGPKLYEANWMDLSKPNDVIQIFNSIVLSHKGRYRVDEKRISRYAADEGSEANWMDLSKQGHIANVQASRLCPPRASTS